jgi:hypothetical protein
MPPKRPAKLKQSIAILRGVARDRAIYAESLVTEREYAREAADLLAYVSYPFDDDVEVSRELSNEIGSMSMDVAALAESSTPGAAVNAAAMALVGYRSAAERHGHAHYLARFDKALLEAAGTEKRFGA